MRWTLSLVLLVVMSVACTGVSVVNSPIAELDPLQAPPHDRALVCVYRNSLIGSVLTIPVRDNRQLVGATEGTGYFCYQAAPGGHLVSVEVSDADPFMLIAAPGQRHDLELIINVGQDRLVAIDGVRGNELATSLSYAVITGTPADDVPLEADQIAPSFEPRTR